MEQWSQEMFLLVQTVFLLALAGAVFFIFTLFRKRKTFTAS